MTRSLKTHVRRAKRAKRTRTRVRSARRALTIPCRIQLSPEEQAELPTPPRPRTRGECIRGPRPCPWVGCRYHLYLDVTAGRGSLKLNFPDLEPWELPATCALDQADLDGLILEEVGAAMNVTRERIRQIEKISLAKLAELDYRAPLDELLGEED